MTRANINFIYQNQGEAPRTLFVYHNGDQYPRGLRDEYNVLEFVEGELTPERFKEWVKKNYPNDKLEDLGEGGHPKIYYTNGFITDYSYVFSTIGFTGDEIKVWNWDELIFSGDKKKFIKWIKKQK